MILKSFGIVANIVVIQYYVDKTDIFYYMLLVLSSVKIRESVSINY